MPTIVNLRAMQIDQSGVIKTVAAEPAPRPAHPGHGPCAWHGNHRHRPRAPQDPLALRLKGFTLTLHATAKRISSPLNFRGRAP